MSHSNTEKRQYPRIDEELQVSILSDNNHKQTAITKNISEGGLCLEAEEPLVFDNDSNLHAVLSTDIYPYQIKTNFQFLWNKPLEDNQSFLYGGKFVNLTEEQKILLKRIIWLNKQFIDHRIQYIYQLIDQHAERLKKKVANFFADNVTEAMREVTLLCSQGAMNKKDVQDLVSAEIEKITQKGYEVGIAVNEKNITKEIKEIFRSMIGQWIYQSKITKHAHEKPYGYPGDYELLELLYNNKELSQDASQYIDRQLLNNPYATAVRNRKDMMRIIIPNIIKERSSQDSIRMLNIACGSCRELRELSSCDVNYNGMVHITCLDFDDNALQYSKEKLTEHPSWLNLSFVKENIFNVAARAHKYNHILNKQDIIYSIGLADYLPDRVIKKLFQGSYNALNPQGQLIFAFKDRSKDEVAPRIIDWYCDWHFVPRTKDSVIKLIDSCGLQGSKIDITWEPSGIIFFVTITKANE